jgi:hypothetical protein
MHAAPAYIAETSPPSVRGLLISLKEAAIGGRGLGLAGGPELMRGAATLSASVLASLRPPAPPTPPPTRPSPSTRAPPSSRRHPRGLLRRLHVCGGRRRVAQHLRVRRAPRARPRAGHGEGGGAGWVGVGRGSGGRAAQHLRPPRAARARPRARHGAARMGRRGAGGRGVARAPVLQAHALPCFPPPSPERRRSPSRPAGCYCRARAATTPRARSPAPRAAARPTPGWWRRSLTASRRRAAVGCFG